MEQDVYIKCINNENVKTDVTRLTYQIYDKSKNPLLNARCFVKQGMIDSISFFEGNTNGSLNVLQRNNNDAETYAFVDDPQNTIILKTKQGWNILVNKRTICNVILEKEKIDIIGLILKFILDIVTTPTLSLFKPRTQYMFYEEDEGKLLGTFFLTLGNLHATHDTEGILDLHVALAQAILIDIRRKILGLSE
ncbi:MAG: hypothetical protein AAGU23_01575 [Bacillota bacterium]